MGEATLALTQPEHGSMGPSCEVTFRCSRKRTARSRLRTEPDSSPPPARDWSRTRPSLLIQGSALASIPFRPAVSAQEGRRGV